MEDPDEDLDTSDLTEIEAKFKEMGLADNLDFIEDKDAYFESLASYDTPEF